MKWIKKGLIYRPTGELWWKKSHAYLPTAKVLEDCIRVYYASWDKDRFGRIGFVDLDVDDPSKILRNTTEPILDIGELGAFDDCGVTPSCVVSVGAVEHLYYIGWQRAERVPHMLFTGLAHSIYGSNFVRYSKSPILDRTNIEPFSRSAPYVMIEDGLWKMWYWSCIRWSRDEDGTVRYHNVIRYAESDNGIDWHSHSLMRSCAVCITPEGPMDYAIGRPWVMKDGDLYKMWYSIRSKAKISYRLGYAESPDGLQWTRKDNEVGITVSETGWDSEMICFSSIVDAGGKRYMFYNGNRHGEDGFGYAVLDG